MKVSQITYMVLDMLKQNSDDAFFTEEHVMFLLKKYRSFLIKKERDKERASQDVASEFEQQQICLDLEKVPAIDGEPCTGGYYLRTTKAIPKVMDGTLPRVYPIDYYQGTNISFVSRDRMRYVGSNPYLKNITYASIGPDLHLYLNSQNPQFLYLKQLRMTAVFEDFEDAAGLLCDSDGQSLGCDPLDMDFPIRDYLVPTLLELVVKELSASEYRPEDERNDAKDNLQQTK